MSDMETPALQYREQYRDEPPWSPLTTITVTGFASSFAQIVILRELLVLFYGNELSTGLVFASWLFWTSAGSAAGGWLGGRLKAGGVVLGTGLVLLALLMPGTVLWVRAARIIWEIPLGELVGPPKMLLISLLTTSLLCLVSGCQFALAWAVQSAVAARRETGSGEAADLSAGLDSGPAHPEGHRTDPETFPAPSEVQPVRAEDDRLRATDRPSYSRAEFPTSGADLVSAETAEPPSGKGAAQPLVIFLGEAVGATLGGLFFYFIALPLVPVLTAAWSVSALLLAVAALVLRPWRRRPKRLWIGGLWLAGVLAVASAIIFQSPVERTSRRWQWGPRLLSARDTAYHNLALLRDENLYTMFSNGLWLFSFPDPQTAEEAVHLALLQHPKPRTVLLVGGGIAGLAAEVLKHPDVTRVDYVEPDPKLIGMAEALLPAAATAACRDPRVHLFSEDAGSFIRRTHSSYDVVLLNVGDPMNAELNRFYTVEFYRRVRRLLNPGGIFSFAVSAAPDVIGPAQARMLRSVYVTVRSVFPRTLVFPGEAARFFATDRNGQLVSDLDRLLERIKGRHLQLKYVREYYLFDSLNPMRLAYFDEVLREGPRLEVNRDFRPTCYFNHLALWGFQLHPRIYEALLTLAAIRPSRLWTGIAGLVLALAALFWVGRSRPRAAVGLSVMIVGGMMMMLEIVLLLGFQILEGFVFDQLALIIAFFMAGLALAAGAFARIAGRGWVRRPRRWLMGIQAAICCHAAAVMGLLFGLQQWLDESRHQAPLGLIFSALALMSGILGGLHFSVAVRVMAGREVAGGRIGGGLYALDLAGSALGALAASLFLLPVYGVAATVMAFSLAALGSLATLARAGS